MTTQTILVKDFPEYEQVIDVDSYNVSNSRLMPKYVQSFEGEIFFKLITQHPGIFLQLQKDGEDSAGRAVYKDLVPSELVNKAAEVATLAAVLLRENNWVYSVMSEIEAKEIGLVALELSKKTKE